MRIFHSLTVGVLALVLASCASDGNPTTVQAPLAELAAGLPSPSSLDNIEYQIAEAMNTAFQTATPAPLNDVRARIQSIDDPQFSRFMSYWTAYTDFQTAIFEVKNQRPEASERAALRGLAVLEGVTGKNAEELALQAFIHGFAIQFTEGMETAQAARAATEAIEQAAELAPDNARVQYVLGSLDFYTPAEYGGGKLAADYLRRAIELPARTAAYPTLPSWGKSGAYELLVRHYEGAGQPAVADRYLREGVRLYPDDYLLTAMLDARTN